MASLNPLDHLTLGEILAAAECCAEAASKLSGRLCEPGGDKGYFLRGAVRKLLAASIHMDPMQSDFDRCADIMRKAHEHG